jgi:hypothetical protein
MINQTRSMNTDLQFGVNDGKYKQMTPDRGGEAELFQPNSRYEELQIQYSITDFNRGMHLKGCACVDCSMASG